MKDNLSKKMKESIYSQIDFPNATKNNRLKRFVLVTYLILLFYSKTLGTVINPFLHMYLMNDNFSSTSYL